MKRSKRAALIRALRERPWFMDKKLIELKKGRKGARRSDFIWHYILQSFSTMGNRRGWDGLIGSRDNYKLVRYDNLANLTKAGRRKAIEKAFRNAKLRRAKQKVEWATVNFELIEAAGGVEAVSAIARRCLGRDAKMTFLRGFQGIGEKYARNIWMDVYDPAFRNSIAIDAQIKNVILALGASTKSYVQQEQTLCKLAADAALEPWEMDRLLYSYTPYFLWAINDA